MVAAPANAVASSSASTLDAQSYPRYIDNGHVELYKPIGTGAYGVVFLGVDHSRGQPMYCAVKALRRTGLDDRQRKFQRREMGLHRLASNHPSICRMDRTIDEGDYTYVIMEWGEDGDLFAMITDKQRFVGDDNLIRDVFTQLVDGVEHLHSLGIAHRDIKPENIVCSEGGARVQICDFGLATSEQVSSEFGCGSTFYIAPECLGDWFEAKDYPTQSGDVWSLGVILVNLVCGRNPWRIASPQDESFNSFVADPHFLRRILPISTECLYVLTRIFTINPWERITLPELRHLVSQVGSFTMNEEELRYAHAAAQKGDESLVADTDGASFAAEHNEDEDEDEFDMDRTWSDRSQFRLDIPVDHVPDMDEDDDEDMYHQQARLDADTPPLAHSRSPSSPTGRSRSGSSMGGSLPPTPQLWAEDEPLVPATLPDHGKLAAPDVLAHLNLFRPQQADAAGYKPRVAHHGSSPLASPDFISGNVPLQYYA